MSDSQATFILRSKGTTLGRVVFENEDWPWNRGRFYPAPDFSKYAELFVEAERLRVVGDLEREKRDRVTRQIVLLELQLFRESSGELAGEPDMLWIRGDRVSWRGHSGGLREMARAHNE